MIVLCVFAVVCVQLCRISCSFFSHCCFGCGAPEPDLNPKPKPGRKPATEKDTEGTLLPHLNPAAQCAHGFCSRSLLFACRSSPFPPSPSVRSSSACFFVLLVFCLFLFGCVFASFPHSGGEAPAKKAKTTTAKVKSESKVATPSKKAKKTGERMSTQSCCRTRGCSCGCGCGCALLFTALLSSCPHLLTSLHPILASFDSLWSCSCRDATKEQRFVFVCVCMCVALSFSLSLFLSFSLSLCLSVAVSVSVSLSLSFPACNTQVMLIPEHAVHSPSTQRKRQRRRRRQRRQRRQRRRKRRRRRRLQRRRRRQRRRTKRRRVRVRSTVLERWGGGDDVCMCV